MTTRSFEDLRRQAQDQWKTLGDSPTPRILIGAATCGRSAGAMEVFDTFERESRDRGLGCSLMEVGTPILQSEATTMIFPAVPALIASRAEFMAEVPQRRESVKSPVLAVLENSRAEAIKLAICFSL